MVKYIIIFSSLLLLISCKEEIPSNVISTHWVDLDDDGHNEKIVYYYKNGCKDSIFLAIEIKGQFNDRWDTHYNKMVDDHPGGSIGLIDLGPRYYGSKRDAVGIVVIMAPSGSAGYGGYKIIADPDFKTIYSRHALYQGSFEVSGNKIIEWVGDPEPNDANCCPSYYKKREVKFYKDRHDQVWKAKIKETRVKAEER